MATIEEAYDKYVSIYQSGHKDEPNNKQLPFTQLMPRWAMRLLLLILAIVMVMLFLNYK
jgi:hypothetical protein